MKRFYVIVFLTLIFLLPLSKTAYAKGFDAPDIRLVIGNSILNLRDNATITRTGALVPVRLISETFGAYVNWDESSRRVMVKKGSRKIIPQTTVINGRAMAEASFIADLFDARVEIFKCLRVISVTDNKTRPTSAQIAAVLPSFMGYTREDLDWLAKIVHAEARGENFAAKLAVANVVLNRVASDIYPSTVREVIFDTRSGVQFTPTVNGALFNTPSEESFLAAMEALEGKNNASNTLFFINPRIAQSSWVSRNRTFAFALGNHNFYY